MAVQPYVGPCPLFQFRDPVHSRQDSLDGGISPSQGRYLHTEQHKQNKYKHISIRQVGFEPTTPVLKRPKTVHASDHEATVIGFIVLLFYINTIRINIASP
jgi:hypothetical protein